jgi:hypothetical protein
MYKFGTSKLNVELDHRPCRFDQVFYSTHLHAIIVELGLCLALGYQVR